ncbi:MAG: histidine kinase, partial [Bacillota bacterium]
FLALSAFLLVIIGVLSNYITQPLLLAARQLKDIREGDYSVAGAKSWIREIAEIRGNLNDVAVHIDELIKDVREESRLREKLYYESLMAQINPHFLYNSLNSIKWISTLNGNTLAADMLGKLGNILHYSFDSNQYSISVDKEIAFLNDYVAMLQLRYGNSIDFSVDIDPSLYSATIPRFCLQPLIENAFMHGLFSRPDGRITLSAAVEGDQLTLTVADDGVGMDEQTAALALSDDPGRKISGTGIGLPNVHNRIQLLYGSRYGLRIDSKPGEGCRIDVVLPFVTEQT